MPFPSEVITVLFIAFVNTYIMLVGGDSSVPELCGFRNKTCIDGQATCINNACICDKSMYDWGDGHFACYKDNQVAAEVRNDPEFTNFNQETTNFPYPCRYLVTHVLQELKDNTRTAIGTCEFKIHAFHNRARGKMYVYGVDIAAKINYQNGTIVSRSVRKYGNTTNDVPILTVEGVKDYRPDGPWTPTEDIEYHDVANNVRVRSYKDVPNNRLVFEVESCGLLATFTPYDIAKRINQIRMPGLSVAINNDHHPVWLSNGDVIGLAPGTSIADIMVPGFTSAQSLIFRAFTRDITQNHPEVSPACPVMKQIVDSCNVSEANSARDSCRWMLIQPRYIKCISDNGFDYLEIFKGCVAAWCTQTNCSSLVTDVSTCSHVKGIPKLEAFVNGDLCPEP